MRKAALLYGVYVGLVFAPFLLLGKVFVPGDFLSFIYPWRAYMEGFPHNIELFDVAVFFLPQDVFLNESLKSGVLPLWNPHIFSGHPSVASGQSGFFYPPRLFFHYFFSVGVAKTLLQLGHLFGMGLGMYWFLRLKSLDSAPAALGGLVWMGNSYVSSWLEFEHVEIAGFYLPLMLGCFEKAVAGARRWWLGLAPLGALCLHSGHLQISLYVGLIFLVYALFRLSTLRQWKPLFYFVGVGVLTVAMAAPTIVPFLQFLGESQRTVLDMRANSADLGSILLTLLNPDLLGNPTRGFMLNRCQSNLIYPEFACFAGIVPLILALCARGREALLLKGVCAGCLIVAASVFPVALPFLDRFIPGRILLVWVFCVAYLAALGAQQLKDSQETRRWARRLGGLFGFLWVVILGVVLYLLRHPELVLEWWTQNPQLVKLPPGGVSEGEFLQAFRANYAWNPQLLLTLAGPIALFWKPQKIRVLIGITLLELALFTSGFNTAVAPEELLRSTPEISAMLESPGRVVPINCANYNTLTPYGLSLVNGYESLVSQRYALMLSQAEPDRDLPMRSLSFKQLDSPIVDALGVTYAVFPPHMSSEAEGWELVFEGQGGKVYKNQQAMPRWYLLGKVAPLHNLAQLQTFIPSSEAFVAEAPPANLQPGPGAIEKIGETANSLELMVETQTTQLLVVTDAFHPGWQVRVNDQPREIFSVNLGSRGIYLTPGVHRVEFQFYPNSLRWSVWACLAAMLVSLGLLVTDLWRSYRS
ncbi:MAG: hypothetical protein WC314_00345 [Vulcanimicrobiota bacterium]